MLYYNGSTYLTDTEVASIGSPQSFGYFKIIDVFSAYSPPLERLHASAPQYNENGYYERIWCAVQYTKDELLLVMQNTQEEQYLIFQGAFAAIDAKRPRSLAGLVLALVDKSIPEPLWQEDMSTEESAAEVHAARASLTPEQEKRIIDLGILYEVEEVAQVNRDLLAKLSALTITEDMTLEEAQEITLRIASAKPWLPWKQQTPPTTPQAPSQSIENEG